jgi:hypothetical protein
VVPKDRPGSSEVSAGCFYSQQEGAGGFYVQVELFSFIICYLDDGSADSQEIKRLGW